MVLAIRVQRLHLKGSILSALLQGGESMRELRETTKWKGTCKSLLSRTGVTGPISALWYGIALFALTAVYFGTGYFGLSLGAFSGFATLVWLPSGIAVASLFLWDYRLWPGVALGAFLVTLFRGASPFVAIGISIGN